MKKVILLFMLCFPVVSFCQLDPEQVVLMKEMKASEENAKHAKPKESKIKGSIVSTDTSLPRITNDTLYTTAGFNIVEGQIVKLGMGSMPDGDFKFIRTNAASLFNYHSNTGYNGLANQANSFPRSQSGMSYTIKKIEKRGDKDHGYAYYAKFGAGIVNYEIDVENAIATGELSVPDQFKPKNKTTPIVVEVKQSFSVADELAKFKKLLDDGVITKEEFEVQKKKLLQ